MDIEAAINRIKYYAFAEKGWSKRELARQADIGEMIVRNIHDDNWNPTLQNLKKLEAVVPNSFSLAELTGGNYQPLKKNAHDQG